MSLGRALGALLVACALVFAAAPPALAQGVSQVSDIVIVGSQRIDDATVRSYMRIDVGDSVGSADVDRALKELFSTGLFADVTIRREGGRLIVNVVENPIINRLAFEGNRRIDDDTLRAEVQLRPRVVYTLRRIQNDVQRIIQVYRRTGRFAATVEPKIIQRGQNRVDLVFEVSEGPLARIRRISFIGNRTFSDAKLRGAVATKETRFYRFLTGGDTYDPDRLTADRDLLRRFYLERGYAEFRVVSAVAELSADRKDFFITFSVDEGEQYAIGEVDVQTTLRNLDPARLRGVVTMATGDTYDAEEVDNTIEKIAFEVGRLGYAFADVQPRLNLDREARTIDIVYGVNEGRRVYVERIEIRGNVRTLDKVIRREFRLVEGDAFNTAKLRRSLRNVRGLGFFETVNITPEPGSAEDKSVIAVEVSERSTGDLTFGAGFSTTDAVIADISIRERNLLGKGQDLRASLGLSARRQSIDISFTEPFFLERNVAAGFDVFRRRREQRESSFNQTSIGFALRAEFPIAQFLRQSVSYGLRSVDIDNVDINASRFIRDQEGATVTSEVGYALTYDLRDDVIEPREGFVIRGRQTLAGFGGDARFLRSSLDYAQYIPLLKDLTGVLTFKEGFIVGIGQDIRINERFFLGGNSFRGFETAGVGPRDRASDDSLGGNLFYVGSVEALFPLGLPEEFGIVGRVFTEFGSLTLVDDSGANIFDVGSVRASAGAGVSVRSPLFGPLGLFELDITLPILKEDVDETEIFRFSLGTRL